jgi:hypothetical protein
MALDYSLLKKIASKAGLSPSEILALAPQNDPFYVGAKGQLQKGQWFAAVYHAMTGGAPLRVHTRRVHYWLVTTNAVAKPNGKPYENTQNDWGLLCLAAKYARYLGLVPIENIIDRRNPEPIIHAHHWPHQKASSIKDSIDESNIIESIVEQFNCFNPVQTQPYMIETWIEKSTCNDVFEPLCAKYGMNLVTGLGELSITAVYLLAQRIVQAKKPVRILYISDFDPAGESMPLAVSRKIEYFVRNYNLGDRVDIKLIPLMLTAEQCREYDLPRTPIKDTEKRKDKFEDRHGLGATELDAMEALHPGEMAKIIEREIEPYFDAQAWSAAIQKNREIQERVREYLVGGDCPDCEDGLIAGLRGCQGCNGLGENKSENPCKTCGGKGVVETGFDCVRCLGTGSIPGKIGTDILTDLEVSTFDSYSPPQVEPHNDTQDANWLYDNSLDYMPQIERYREHKTQGQGGEESSSIDGPEVDMNYRDPFDGD